MATASPVQLELANLRRDWCVEVFPQVALLLPSLGEFTTDDLHGVIHTRPEHFNWWGVLMAKLRNEGLIERIGARPSKRPEANGRLIAVWRHLPCRRDEQLRN